MRTPGGTGRVELTQVERRLRRIVEAIADGVPARTLKDELLAREAGRSSSRPSSPPRPRRSSRCCIPTWPRSTGRKWPRCRGAGGRGDADEAFELIRSLLDKIVLVPEGEELRIEIHGELAGILELCQQAKRPAGAGRQLSK